MEINLNGKKVKTECTTLLELVLQTGLDSGSLVAELNFKVIQQQDWQDIPIIDGDQIELLSFVGGG